MFYTVNLRKKRKYFFFFLCLCIIICIVLGIKYFFPIKHYGSIDKFAKEYNLQPAFICAMIKAESGFDENAKSPRGASGLMQLMKQTADWGAEEIGIEGYDYSRIFEPEVNIQIGCWYMNKLINQYDGNVKTALAAYNAGSGNVSKWLGSQDGGGEKNALETVPFPETEEYMDRVLNYEKAYEILLKLYVKFIYKG